MTEKIKAEDDLPPRKLSDVESDRPPGYPKWLPWDPNDWTANRGNQASQEMKLSELNLGIQTKYYVNSPQNDQLKKVVIPGNDTLKTEAPTAGTEIEFQLHLAELLGVPRRFIIGNLQ